MAFPKKVHPGQSRFDRRIKGVFMFLATFFIVFRQTNRIKRIIINVKKWCFNFWLFRRILITFSLRPAVFLKSVPDD